MEHPVTLGQHLKKARLERGMIQKEVAAHMGIVHETYIGWERDLYLPHISGWKAVIEFLSYYPILDTLVELNRFIAKRRHLGISIRAVAHRLGIDENTYSRIEHGEKANGKDISYALLVERFFSLP